MTSEEAELKRRLYPVMRCLQPKWREELMKDDGYWEDEIINREEYLRVKEWWVESGTFDQLCDVFIVSFKKFFPEIEVIGIHFHSSQDEWVNWIFEFFEWWPDSFDEFLVRVLETTFIGDLSHETLERSLRDWWASSEPIYLLKSALTLTQTLEVSTRKNA